jgi:hypothetical protein
MFYKQRNVIVLLCVMLLYVSAACVQIAFAQGEPKVGKIGYVGLDGKLVIEPKFFGAGSFHYGLAPVLYPDRVTVQYINKRGEIVLTPSYNGKPSRYGLEFTEGLAAVATEQGVGYINLNGDFVIEPKYKYAIGFSEGRAVVGQMIDGKEVYGYIDRSGKEVIPLQYSFAWSFKNGYARVISGGTKSVLVGALDGTCVKLEGKPGREIYINKKGKVVDRIPDYFDYKECSGLRSFYDKKSSLYGFKNKAGVIVIKPTFSKVSNFSEGLAGARIGKAYGANFGYIDTSGNFVISPTFSTGGQFNEGLASVGKYQSGEFFVGYINKVGKIIVPLKYKHARMFSEGMAVVEIR